MDASLWDYWAGMETVGTGIPDERDTVPGLTTFTNSYEAFYLDRKVLARKNP